MGRFLETETQNLAELCLKSRIQLSHSGTSEAENNQESELEATDTDRTDDVDPNNRGVPTEGLKNSAEDCIKSENTSSNKLRVSSRSANRRAVAQWIVGQRRRKTGTLSAPKGKRFAYGSMKREPGSRNHCSGNRCSPDRREEDLTEEYSRYVRAHHQNRLNKQLQHQNQHRAITAVGLHPSHSRAIPLSDSVRRRVALSKASVVPYYLKTGRRLESKISRLNHPTSRAGWTSVKRSYYQEKRKVSPVSNISLEDPNVNGGISHRSSIGTPRTRDVTPDPAWSSSKNASSDELDNNNLMEESATDEGASLHMREVKAYYGKGQRSRISCATSFTDDSRFYSNTNARRLSKAVESSFKSSREVQLDRLNKSSEKDRKSIQHRTLTRPVLVQHGCSSINKHNLSHFRAHSRFNNRGTPGRFPSQRNSASPRPRSCFVPTAGSRQTSCGQRSDASDDTTQDERLYCLCKKLSYGDMIACDNKNCQVEWFHFMCVDIRVQPKGKWYCPLCRGDSSKLKRTDV